MEVLSDKKFRTCSEMEEFFKTYGETNNIVLFKIGTHKTNDKNLIYHSLSLKCSRAGQSNTGKGKRKSKKCSCPFRIKINTQKDKGTGENFLAVIASKSHFVHNEQCNKQTDEEMKQKNLNPIEKKSKRQSQANMQKDENPECGQNKHDEMDDLDKSLDQLFNYSLKAVENVSEKNTNVTKSTDFMDNYESSESEMFPSLRFSNSDKINQESLNETLLDISSLKEDNKEIDIVTSTLNDSSTSEINESSLENVVFKTKNVLARGRPLNSKKNNTIGLPLVKKLTPYAQKNNFGKAKILLKFLVPADYLHNILENSYEIKVKDIEHLNAKNLADIFIEKEVDIQVLRHFLNNEALQYLGSIIATKDKEYFTCFICKKDASDRTIACDQCLIWYHFSCLGVNEEDVNLEEDYFCKFCVESL